MTRVLEYQATTSDGTVSMVGHRHQTTISSRAVSMVLASKVPTSDITRTKVIQSLITTHYMVTKINKKI